MKFVIMENKMYYGRYKEATFNCKTEAEMVISEWYNPNFFKVHPFIESKGELKSCNDT